MKDYAEKSTTIEAAGTYVQKCTLYANIDSNVTVTFNNYDPTTNVTLTLDVSQGVPLYNVSNITCNSGCVTCAV